MQRQKFFPTEHVIALTVRQQISVLDRPNPHYTGDFPPLRLRQFRTLLRNDLESALFSFIEQIGELYGIARARLERLAILAHNGTEPDVLQFRFRFGMPAPKNF